MPSIAFRLVPLQQPDLYRLFFFNVFYWLLSGIFAWWTLRMIRLRYWQPWTTPDQWELGGETGPPWAKELVRRRFREQPWNIAVKLLDRSRPPGYAARGTSVGLLGQIGLSAAGPIISMMSLLPVYTNGIDLMLAALPYIVGNCLIFNAFLTLGLHKRRLWYIYFMFVSGCLLLGLYAIGFLFNLVVLLRLIPLQAPDLYRVSFYIAFCWLLSGIFAWWTLRMIRLRYWQPWTTPDQWEPGDETGQLWAQRMRERRMRDQA